MSGIPDLWHPETVYLNTASFGLPPDSGVGGAAGARRPTGAPGA